MKIQIWLSCLILTLLGAGAGPVRADDGSSTVYGILKMVGDAANAGGITISVGTSLAITHEDGAFRLNTVAAGEHTMNIVYGGKASQLVVPVPANSSVVVSISIRGGQASLESYSAEPKPVESWVESEDENSSVNDDDISLDPVAPGSSEDEDSRDAANQ